MRRHSNKLTIAIIVLVLVAAFTGYQVYKYWYTPRTIEAQHFLYVDVDTSKNLTLEETLGYTGDLTVKYIIIPTGGIYFYTLSPGQNLTRGLEVENIWNVPVDITTTLTGDMAPWMIIDGPDTLKPKEQTIINLTVVIPTENVYTQKYKGNLSIRFTPR
ncbi:hypothetical protein KY319_01735 [Candidatus Woesearchaeota archaeon]|nr:hypothetical protein [Candidatus Woesearchaeota archaeon]